MKTLAMGALVLTAITATAFADNLSGPYVGGGYGQFDLHINNLDDVGEAVSQIAHSSDDAWQIFGGWRLAPYFALEGTYIDLGRSRDSFTAAGSEGRYRVHMDGFSPSAIGIVPLGPMELFAKVGYLYYNVNVAADVSSASSAAVESSHSRSDFLYGGGVGVTFIDHLHIRAEYERLDLTRYRQSNALWLTAAWRF